jgi:AraC-like DNA-binding protein
MTNVLTITLPGHYVSQIFELIAEKGSSVAQLCQQFGVPVSDLDDAQVSMPWSTFRALVEMGVTVFGGQAFGLLLGERMRINTHGALGYAALNTTSLRELVNVLERYLVLRTDLYSLDIENVDGGLKLSFRENWPLAGLRKPVSEAVMLAIRNIFDFATLGQSGIQRVGLALDGEMNLEHLKLAEDIFDSPVSYSRDWVGFYLAEEVLDRPLKMANASSYQEALAICQDELQKLELASGLSGVVKKFLLNSSKNGFPALEVVARHFHMTPRTLHRKLVKENSSYQSILDSTRHLLAIRYLDQPNMTLQEIAYVLGYAELSNFRRAFKRWEGIAPSEYREG